MSKETMRCIESQFHWKGVVQLPLDCVSPAPCWASLEIINRPPTRSKPLYMKVWEARKADGLDYDPEDERQQHFLAEITKYNLRSID